MRESYYEVDVIIGVSHTEDKVIMPQAILETQAAFAETQAANVETQAAFAETQAAFQELNTGNGQIVKRKT